MTCIQNVNIILVSYIPCTHYLKLILYSILGCLCFDSDLLHEVTCRILLGSIMLPQKVSDLVAFWISTCSIILLIRHSKLFWIGIAFKVRVRSLVIGYDFFFSLFFCSPIAFANYFTLVNLSILLKLSLSFRNLAEIQNPRPFHVRLYLLESEL